LQSIRDAGGYFRISRSLRTAYDVGIGLPRLKPVLDALDRIPDGGVTDATLLKVVSDLRRDIGKPYGNRDVLSAATKFLWLRHRDVVIIHDSQARLALGAPVGDYASYLDRWRELYSRIARDVTEACDRLKTAQFSAPAARLEAEADVSSEWFKRRVFDIYLWKAGARA
jgi:hypothetical protein